MARRRMRTIGALVINPRRSRRTASALSNPRRKRRTKVKANPRRRKLRRRARGKVRARSRRSGRKVRTRRNRAWTGKFKNYKAISKYKRKGKSVSAHERRTNPRKRRRARRRNPSSPFYRVNGRKRKGLKVRRARSNPAFVGKIQGMFRKIPVIGTPLSMIAGFAPHAAIGAATVELPLRGAAMIGQAEWMPESIKGSVPVYLAVAGAVLGVAAMYLVPGSAETKQRVAIGIASANAGAAFLAWRLGLDATQMNVSGLGAIVASPSMGAIAMDGSSYGSYGLGPAYSVGPQGYGAVLVGS